MLGHRRPKVRSRVRRVLLTVVVASALFAPTAFAGSLSGPYTNSNFLLPFVDHSHWLQPWRSYLETMPASTFVDAPGMSFNLERQDPDLVAEMLARHGVKHVRIELGWGTLTYEDETQLDHGGPYARKLIRAARDHGLRPMILLNSHEGVPCPSKLFYGDLAADAPQGARTVEFMNTDGFIPGYTGLSNLTTDYRAADVIITSLSGNVATLSKPLPKAVTAKAGTTEDVAMATLKYLPFSDPASPEYRATVDGWKRYIANIAAIVTEELGTAGAADKGFDIEIWNELTFGQGFLHINNYYDPPYHPYAPPGVEGYKENTIYDFDLIEESAAYIAEHDEEFSGVKLTNGFANTIPWPASSLQHARVDAISKHPYAGRHHYPAGDQSNHNPALVNVNALFGREPLNPFIPTYSQYMPEHFATHAQTETIIRDMSPINNLIYDKQHGRNARVIGGIVKPVTTWMTEFGMSPREDNPAVTRDQAVAMKAKVVARSLAFFVNKGVTQLDFFGHTDTDRGLGLINENFLTYADELDPPPYPADDTQYTSPALRVMGRMSDKMSQGLDESLTAANTRPISVTNVTDTHNRFQFAGDGTLEHPKLFDRELLAILPFQVNASRFVIPYYVQTRDIARALAPEQFTVSLSGINGRNASVSVYDPINDTSVPVTVLASSRTTIKLRLTTTDYPYMLTIDERVR